MKRRICLPLFATAFLVAGVAFLAADGKRGAVKSPGYRPKSDHAELFLSKLSESRVAVLPTLIMTRDGMQTSEASQKATVAYLEKHQLGRPSALTLKMDLGKPKGKFQYDFFTSRLKELGPMVKKQSGADYFLVLEHLVSPSPSGDRFTGGIHIYVLDAQGRNAFSFLLNSHHKIFADASLKSGDSSSKGLANLVEKATGTAMAALKQQIQEARKD